MPIKVEVQWENLPTVSPDGSTIVQMGLGRWVQETLTDAEKAEFAVVQAAHAAAFQARVDAGEVTVQEDGTEVWQDGVDPTSHVSPEFSAWLERFQAETSASIDVISTTI